MSDLNLNVAMIGPRGCGKTSVLSIMLAEVENFIARLNTNPNVQKYCFPEIKADSFCIETLKSSYETSYPLGLEFEVTKLISLI